jgi:hypothetical protein
MKCRNYPNEVWKRLINDLEDSEIYEISNYGRIKSYKCHPQGKIIKTPKVKGYPAIVVKLKNGKTTTKYIHKLVAEHFLPKESDLQQYVIHLDFDKDNNHVSNLCWVTRSTMFAHQKINPNYQRGKTYNAKLTETEVRKIKKLLLSNNINYSEIAREFGITHTQVNRIRKGINWTSIEVS